MSATNTFQRLPKASSTMSMTSRICGWAGLAVRSLRIVRHSRMLAVTRMREAVPFGRMERAICGVQPSSRRRKYVSSAALKPSLSTFH